MEKKKTHILIILILLIFTAVPVSSQTLKTADMYFKGGAYFTAAKMYRDLVNLKNKNTEVKTRRGEILFRIGECYRKMNKPTDAKKWYIQAENAGYTESDLYYSLGNIQLNESNYADAKASFKAAKDKNPGDMRIESKIMSCDLYETYSKENGQYQIKPVESLNTRGSEYGLSFYGDKLIFASTGVGSSKKTISERTGLPYSDIYMASPDSRSVYGKQVKLESMSNSKVNEGTFCYDVREDQLYCTRCEQNNKGCSIVKINIKDGKYKESGKLKLGKNTYGAGHPYITEDGDRIYFTSTMEGGYGGADLWYVDRGADGQYGYPVNLGENINTAGDEVFPSFIDNVLYFASDGHPGLGGLDLFASYIEEDETFSKPFNLRAPINSSWDDFNLVHRPNSTTGLFITNRNNAKNSDDIYMFDNFPPQLLILNGQVYDEETKAPIKDYTVAINDGTTKIYERKVTDENGYFIYIGQEKNYNIQITSPGYLSGTKTVNTAGVKLFSELGADIYLVKEKIAEQPVTVPVTKTPITIVMKDIFYEFDKFRLTEASKHELDNYIEYFNQYPDMIVEINSHTDSQGSHSYNKKLSEDRAKAVVEYFMSKGISSNRLLWRGYGESQLIIPNARTEAEHQANRRTVFKILKLGDASVNTEIRNVSTSEIPNSSQNIIDISGWWLQVHESTSYNEFELPIIKQARRISGKNINLVKSSDGKYLYCIQYATKNEALQTQLLLLKENVHTALMQF
ncbi:MAG: OmpA family protein [Prevotellaceae bacterium]|jgi:peptidoglycan-associated lipoprotein|nr:OmpA family protein [Prevotellaceae bacterium]